MRRIRIDPHAQSTRTFEGFGTSLAWWANAVGRLPGAERVATSRRFFSLADGGLGLNVARFNVGGGEQPGVPLTMDPRAVMEGYRPGADQALDERADPGQRAVLRDAVRFAAEEGRELTVEVFGNSPPWWATRSGSVTGASNLLGRPAPNLDFAHAHDYLRYLSDVADFLERDAGVRVASVSPFNEPTSSWWRFGGRQEGCHFTRAGIARLLRDSAVADSAGGSSSDDDGTTSQRIISASEEWSLGQARWTWNQLDPVARRAVGRMNVHTYSGQRRASVRARAAQAGIGLWVSEFGVGDESGAKLAEMIVRDLRELDPTAWVLWQAVSPDAWGLLVSDGAGRPMRTAASLEVLARFSRALRPGMRLIGCDDPKAVAALGDGCLAVVAIATSQTIGETIRIDLSRLSAPSHIVAEISIAGRLGPPTRTELELDGNGLAHLEIPAGAVASVVATGCEALPDSGAFLGCGVWWLENGRGLRLGLAASGSVKELAAGVRVAAVPSDDAALAQRWRAESCGGDDVRWVCEASGHTLDIAGSSKRPEAHAIQWWARTAEHSPANQRWQTVEVDDGRVSLRVRHSGLELALDEQGLVVQRPSGAADTCWRLVRADPPAG